MNDEYKKEHKDWKTCDCNRCKIVRDQELDGYVINMEHETINCACAKIPDKIEKDCLKKLEIYEVEDDADYIELLITDKDGFRKNSGIIINKKELLKVLNNET